MAAVGLITSPVMGDIADRYAHEQLEGSQTIQVLEKARTTLVVLAESVEVGQAEDLRAAADLAGDVLATFERTGSLPEIITANALRAVIGSGADSPVVGEAQAILGPADNYGGRLSFRKVAPLSIFLVIVFGFLFVRDRRAAASATDDQDEAEKESPEMDED